MVLKSDIQHFNPIRSMVMGIFIVVILTVTGCGVSRYHHRHQGYREYCLGNPAGAVTHFHQVLEHDPADTVANLCMGWMVYARNDLDSARDFFQVVVDQPDLPDYQKADACHGLARCAYGELDYENTLKYAGESLALQPRQMAVWLIAGWAELALSHIAEAEAAFRNALKLETANGEAWLGIGWVRYYENNLSGAFEAAEKSELYGFDGSLVEKLRISCEQQQAIL